MASVRVSQFLAEALVPADPFDPTTVTGAGVSQMLCEALVTGPGVARVGQIVVEVLLVEDEDPTEWVDPCEGEPGGASTHMYGWAG